MSESIALPFWLFALICFLALWALLGSLLIPGVRWFLRRRVGHVIDELNTRLQLKIQPFKLTKRQVLIDRLIYDPEVLKAVEAHAKEANAPRDEVMAEVGRYAREIVPSFNAYAYFRLGYWLARRCAQLLFRVRVGYVDEVGLTQVPPDASVVFVMNHRSNTDYILVAYLAATRSALSYAVGEWARIWPLQALIKSMGAYFIRRKSGNPLYRLVLARYVRMATDGGVVQAVFPEGGLTKDGRLRPLKLGLISYMVSGFDPAGDRDLLFIPVGINYDRVFEDRSLVMSLDLETKRKGAFYAILVAARFLLHNARLMISRRWYRFGYAGVNFGSALSMKEYLEKRNLDFRALGKEALFPEVEALGKVLIEKVAEVIPVLPVSLVATVFLRNDGKPISRLELMAQAQKLIATLEKAGAHVYIPRKDQEYAINVGLRMLTLRRLVIEEDGLIAAKPDELPLLRYYANSIAHFLEG